MFLSCASEQSKTVAEVNESTNQENEEVIKELTEIDFQEFNREISFSKIRDKVETGKSITIHVRIPLCDNDNQGIVPVSQKLGNGLDLRNNLYWGAKFGLKNHFKKYTDWKSIRSELDISNEILERVIFSKKLSNGANVYLIADAYRGDKMKECLIDYLSSVAGKKSEQLQVNSIKIGLNSDSDLLIFNGHNGLMDYNIEFIPSKDNVVREASVIGCISHKYFKDHLLASKGYPILMTTNLMAPEAYVLESVIESWLKLKNGEEIRKDAGRAYHKYQKCGINGATKLFITGW